MLLADALWPARALARKPIAAIFYFTSSSSSDCFLYCIYNNTIPVISLRSTQFPGQALPKRTFVTAM
jgi:hypothetical protein